MRIAVSAAAGALFGLGLLVSGMTDTARVRGFLAMLGPGPWDPTLAFVMGAGLLPMVVAWRLSRGVAPAPAEIDPPLLLGAVLFGAGWGLSGLCPGPALAALTWGGVEVAVFTAAMAAGMIALPHIRKAA